MASIAFMYQKPPGYEAAQARDREVEARRAAQVGEGEVGGEGREGGYGGGGVGVRIRECEVRQSEH